jgi:uncharacterized protein YbaR (Trm112 family)
MLLSNFPMWQRRLQKGNFLSLVIGRELSSSKWRLSRRHSANRDHMHPPLLLPSSSAEPAALPRWSVSAFLRQTYRRAISTLWLMFRLCCMHTSCPRPTCRGTLIHDEDGAGVCLLCGRRAAGVRVRERVPVIHGLAAPSAHDSQGPTGDGNGSSGDGVPSSSMEVVLCPECEQPLQQIAVPRDPPTFICQACGWSNDHWLLWARRRSRRRYPRL